MEKKDMLDLINVLLDEIQMEKGLTGTIMWLYDYGFSVKQLEEFFNKDDIMYAIDLYKETAEEEGKIWLLL